MFDSNKTRMIALPCGEKIVTIPERDWQTDGQTDRQTEFLYQYPVSVTNDKRDKNVCKRIRYEIVSKRL